MMLLNPSKTSVNQLPVVLQANSEPMSRMETNSSMSAGWSPVNENHAIDVMAAVISFAEPIPASLFKKALDSVEDAAFAAGLRSRHSIQSIQFSVPPGGAPVSASSNPGPTMGRIFNSLFEVPAGVPPSARVAEQIQFAQGQILYRTWRYVSWQWQVERMRTLIIPALTLIQDIIPIGLLRLEYLDRFRFDGDLSSISFESVLRRDSPLIAPHVFSRSDLWHSHTGAFLPGSAGTKRLEQVQIDVLDDLAIDTGNLPHTRWVNIMTAREDRFLSPSIDEVSGNINLVFGSFDVMHMELKDLLASIITDAMAKRIYLKGA